MAVGDEITFGDIADAWNSAGVVGMFTKKPGTNKEAGKRNSEAMILEDWVSSMTFAGHNISNVSLLPRDPPDAKCDIDGRQHSIEISTLVNQDFLQEFHGKNNTIGAYHGDGFESLWESAQNFTACLQYLVRKKADAVARAQHIDRPVDILLIRSLEPCLTSLMVEEVIALGARVDAPDEFNDIHFLLDCEPCENASPPSLVSRDKQISKFVCGPLFSMSRGLRLDNLGSPNQQAF